MTMAEPGAIRNDGIPGSVLNTEPTGFANVPIDKLHVAYERKRSQRQH